VASLCDGIMWAKPDGVCNGGRGTNDKAGDNGELAKLSRRLHRNGVSKDKDNLLGSVKSGNGSNADKDVGKWVRRAVYQASFNTLLCLLFGLLLGLYVTTLPPFHPRIRHSASGFNQPGLGFRPRPQDHLSTLIRFRHGYSSDDWESHVDSIKNFQKRFSRGKKVAGNHLKCGWNSTLTETTSCHVSKRKRIDWVRDTACTKAEKFGYPRGQPCVLLKVNQVLGWEPEPYYNITEVRKHSSMPNLLKAKIEKTWGSKCAGKGAALEERCPELRMVWITCEGATPHDTEYMGPVSYTPTTGVRGFYFPYLNQQLYLNPYVFIQFDNLTPGIVVSVHCKIWSKNIRHDAHNPRIGGVQFELLMD